MAGKIYLKRISTLKIKMLYISYLSLLIIAFIAVSEIILKRKYLKEIIENTGPITTRK